MSIVANLFEIILTTFSGVIICENKFIPNRMNDINIKKHSLIFSTLMSKQLISKYNYYIVKNIKNKHLFRFSLKFIFTICIMKIVIYQRRPFWNEDLKVIQRIEILLFLDCFVRSPTADFSLTHSQWQKRYSHCEPTCRRGNPKLIKLYFKIWFI